MMVVVKLSGGLGNQLFQYAFAKSVACRRQCPLWLDATSISKDCDPAHPRAYRLDRFEIDAGLAERIEGRSNRFCLGGEKYRVVRQPFFRPKNSLRHTKERGFCFDPKMQELKGPVYLTGYWQSEKYFKDSEHAIRSELVLKEPLSAAQEDALRQIESAAEPVSVAFRRGDFASHPHHSKFHGTCGIEYYYNAFKFIGNRCRTPHLFVFSDDLEWVKKEIKFPYPVTYVDQPYDHVRFDHVDLYLMSRCRHHIIANSTYSWWGAWLNPRADKTVVAPRAWFRDSRVDTRDIIPPGWVQI